MTSDDEYEVHVLPGYIPIFWCFVGIGIILFYYSLGYAKTYSTTAAFLLTPFICFSLIFDNAIMATTGIDRRRASTQAMLAFHSCIVPMLLLVCYELAYMVHKHKSVNFCGIMFDSGRDNNCNNAEAVSKRRQLWSMCLRLVVWLVGCALLVLNLLVAYKWTSNLSLEITSLYELQGDNMAHALSAILPALVLVILALYIGLQLWNYGTHYSYMVHATCFNPWIWMLVGAVSLLVGYLMPSPIYALSSNAGEMIMMATIVRMFREVHYDMQQGLQLGEFIDPEGAAARRQELQLSDKRSLRFCRNESQSNMEHPSGYVAVTTPKGSELPATFTNQLRRGHQESEAQASASAAYLSVIVARECTNPLCR